MATYNYYKAVSDDGGNPGDQITSGQVNALFNILTSQERITGSDKIRKMYIEPDETVTVFVGIEDQGDFETCLFASSGDSETIGDLTGNEPRFGAAKVISTGTKEITVERNDNWVFFRDGEYIAYLGDWVQVDSVTVNATDIVLSLSEDLPTYPAAGDYITSLLQLSVSANTKQPIWRENLYEAGSPKVDEYNTVQVLILE